MYGLLIFIDTIGIEKRNQDHFYIYGKFSYPDSQRVQRDLFFDSRLTKWIRFVPFLFRKYY